MHHYLFSHFALRERAFDDPKGLVKILSLDSGMEYLESLWDSVGRTNIDSAEEYIHSSGIWCYPFTVDKKFQGVIVQPPPPYAPTEVYFIAIVISNGKKSINKSGVRYFTLEKNAEDSYAPLLCEWENTEHINLGIEVPASQSFFAEVIRATILGYSYDPWSHRERFEEWMQIAKQNISQNGILSVIDSSTIWDLAKVGSESNFHAFLSSDQFSGTGIAIERSHQAQPVNAEYDLRPESIKWSREYFGKNLLPSDHPTRFIARSYTLETIRKHINVTVTIVFWAAILLGVLSWFHAPLSTLVVVAIALFLTCMFYLSVTRIRQLKKCAALVAGLTGASGLLEDNDFKSRLGFQAKRATRLNKILELSWFAGFLAFIPLMLYVFGFTLGAVICVCVLIVALLILFFTITTEKMLFDMAIANEGELWKREKNELQKNIDQS